MLWLVLVVAALVVGVLEVRIARLGKEVADLRERVNVQPKAAEAEDDTEDAHGAASNA